MEVNEFISNLKSKYSYSDEMVQFLQKAIPSIITYYGEDKKDVIFAALNNCEIHIQRENENSEEYLNQYFGSNKKWDIPFLGGAFQHTELTVRDNIVQQQSIIYMKTEYLHRYKPFDFNDEEKLSGIIHEMCHAIKGYGKLKVENGQVITSTGLLKDYFEYDKSTNTLTNTRSDNTGLEEALNSYDEAEIMTIMTGVKHEFGAYKGMTQVARELMKHEELASVIRASQFSGRDEWSSFLGKEDSEYLSKNFEDWVSVLYSSPAELMDNKANLMEKMRTAMNNVAQFANNYSTPNEVQTFEESKRVADQKTIDVVKQIIYYNSQTNSFEQVEQTVGRTL